MGISSKTEKKNWTIRSILEKKPKQGGIGLNIVTAHTYNTQHVIYFLDLSTM